MELPLPSMGLPGISVGGRDNSQPLLFITKGGEIIPLQGEVEERVPALQQDGDVPRDVLRDVPQVVPRDVPRDVPRTPGRCTWNLPSCKSYSINPGFRGKRNLCNSLPNVPSDFLVSWES